MILVCPECSGPFELEQENIAALVQIACPHCEYRMILDFEAANNPALVEQGMRMASGFRSAADYRASAGTPAAARLEAVPSEPAPTPAPAPRPEKAPPTAAPAARPATARPAARPGATVPAPADDAADAGKRRATVVGMVPPTPPPQPELPDYDPDEDAQTQIRSLGSIGPPVGIPAPIDDGGEPVAAPSPLEAVPARGGTVVGPAPTRPAAAPAGLEEAPTTVQPRDRPELRTPPHTPPGRAATRTDSGQQPAIDGSEELWDEQLPKSSPVGTAILVILLLLSGALVATSTTLKGTPDPRPLLEDLYRQYVK